MSHLGRWLSALVDGELDPDERDRVLNHLAGCQPCLQETNAMRALKRRLTALGETSADAEITRRLIELARSDQDLAERASQRRSWPGSRWRSLSRRSRHRSPDQVRPGVRVHELRSAWMMTAGSAGTAIVAIGFAAFLLGAGQPERPVPRVTPSVDSYLLQHSYDTGQVRVSGAGSPSQGSQGLDNPGELDVGRPAPGPQVPSQPDLVPPRHGQSGVQPGTQLGVGAATWPAPGTSAMATPVAVAPGPVDRLTGWQLAPHSPR